MVGVRALALAMVLVLVAAYVPFAVSGEGEYVLTITAPAKNSYHNTQTITAEWTCSVPPDAAPPDHYKVKLDDGDEITTTDTSYTFSDVSEGDHVITVYAFSAYGALLAENQTSFTVDVTKPTLSITYPEELGYSKDELSVTLDVYDLHLDHCEYKIDNGSWLNAGQVDKIDLSGLSEGCHIIKVRYFDLAGNVVEKWRNWTVDVTPPSVSITSPSSGTVQSTNTVTVQWSATDNGEINHYKLYQNGNYVAMVDSGVKQWTFGGLSEGSNTITVKAFDKAGNYATDAITIEVDVTPPTVTISSPADGDLIASDTVTVSWTVSGTYDHVEVRLDGGSWLNVGTSTSHTFSGLSDGQHTVDVKAVDAAGNYGVDSVTFTADPDIVIFFPDPEVYVSAGTPYLFTVWQAENGAAYYKVEFQDNVWNVGDNTSAFIPIDWSQTGDYMLKITAVDGAGNEIRSGTRLIHLVSSEPIKFDNLENGQVFGTPDLTFSWTVNVDANMSKVVYDANLIEETGTSHALASVPDGAHFFGAYAVSTVAPNRGYFAGALFGVLTGFFNVTITITEPPDNSTIQNLTYTTTLSVEGSDFDQLIAPVIRVYLDDDMVASIPISSTGSYSTDITGTEGTHTEKAELYATLPFEPIAWHPPGGIHVVVDSDQITVTLQEASTAPEVTITNPASGQQVVAGEVITATWTVDGAYNYSEVTVLPAGEQPGQSDWHWVGTATSYEINTTGYVGDTTFWVHVVGPGGDAVASVTFTVLVEAHLYIDYPADGDLLGGHSITVLISSNIIMDSIEIKLDGSLAATENAGNRWNVTLWVPDGTHRIRVNGTCSIATSVVGDEIMIEVDTTPPEVTITNPPNNAVLTESEVVVEWSCAEAHLDHFVVQWGNESVSTVENSITLTLEDGSYTVTVIAYDQLGHTGSASVTFTVHTTPPSVTITSPADGIVVNTNQVTISWTASGIIDHYTINVDSQGEIDIGTVTTYTTTLSDGSHTVVVRAYDPYGLYGEDQATFTVNTEDQGVLGVVITYPTENAVVTDRNLTVTFEIHISDVGQPDITDIVLQLDKGNDGSYEKTWHLDPAARSFTIHDIAEGEYALKVTVHEDDPIGDDTYYDVVHFVVQNGVSGGAGDWLDEQATWLEQHPFVAVLLVVLVLAALSIFLRR